MQFERMTQALAEMATRFRDPPGPNPLLADLIAALVARDQLLAAGANTADQLAVQVAAIKTEYERVKGELEAAKPASGESFTDVATQVAETPDPPRIAAGRRASGG